MRVEFYYYDGSQKRWFTKVAKRAPASSPLCAALRNYYYCCYDKRKRLNYHQKQRNIP